MRPLCFFINEMLFKFKSIVLKRILFAFFTRIIKEWPIYGRSKSQSVLLDLVYYLSNCLL